MGTTEEFMSRAPYQDRLRDIDRLRALNAELVAALNGILDWYARLQEPGRVPAPVELTARLREAQAALAKAEGVA